MKRSKYQKILARILFIIAPFLAVFSLAFAVSWAESFILLFSLAVWLYLFSWKLPRMTWRNIEKKWNYRKFIFYSATWWCIIIPFSVVILVLLSPCFGNSRCDTDKAKQKEPSTLIASYIKASQAYYTEYGTIAKSSKDLGQYMTVTGCKKNNHNFCKTARTVNYSNSNSTTWYTPSGYYEITMQAKEKGNIFIAKPSGKYSKKGLGVSGCYNSQTGETDVLEMTTKGRNVTLPDCSGNSLPSEKN